MTPPEGLVARIRAEYGEMPGLRLTVSQAARLWQMDAGACEAVLQALVAEGFLKRTDDGSFITVPTTSKRPKPSTPPSRLPEARDDK